MNGFFHCICGKRYVDKHFKRPIEAEKQLYLAAVRGSVRARGLSTDGCEFPGVVDALMTILRPTCTAAKPVAMKRCPLGAKSGKAPIEHKISASRPIPFFCACRSG